MEQFQLDADKMSGFLENLALNLEKNLWDYLVTKSSEGNPTLLGGDIHNIIKQNHNIKPLLGGDINIMAISSKQHHGYLLQAGCLHTKRNCVKWSKELAMAKTDSNVKYANKVMQFGDVNIKGHWRGTRPSRVIPAVRNIHFLRT